MRNYHEDLVATVREATHKTTSRRGLLIGGAKLAAGGAAAMALASSPASLLGFRNAMAQTFNGPVDVLNYALTLEHLEATFYVQGLNQFSATDFSGVGLSSTSFEYFGLIRDHEVTHVDTLIQVIGSLGGTPVSAAMYDFGYTDVTSFVAVAQVLENVGTGAYTGAAQFLIDNDDLLTAALTIHGVEARHASYLNLLNGEVPFPAAFETPLTPAEVLAAAGPLIVSNMPATGTGSSL